MRIVQCFRPWLCGFFILSVAVALLCNILGKPAVAQTREIGPGEEAATRAADARALQEIQVARDVLAIMEGRLGRDHPELATPLNNLALLYYLQKSYGRAQRLLERSLRIARRTPDHPALASVLHNLGVVYQTRKRYARAARTLERALAVREKTLGREHPEVANSLNNLGALYRKRGQFAKAEHSLQRALAITEKAFNPDHPFVAGSLSNLASLYEATHRYGKAQALLARALAIREKAFDPDHPDIAASRDSLARLSQMRERAADARRRQRTAEAKRGSGYIAHHWRLQGRYAQARAAHARTSVRLSESGRRIAVASARANRHSRACYGKPGLSGRPLARACPATVGTGFAKKDMLKQRARAG